jgi:hypothetical protein
LELDRAIYFDELNRDLCENLGKMQQNSVLNASKRSAISYKTQCYLLQNAVLSPAKRRANSYKTQG